MLAGSLDGGKKRPFGIITGFIIAFVGFALLSRQLLIVLHADPVIVRDVALVLLAVVGICMFSKKLSDKLFGATQGLANWGANITARWESKQGDGKQGYWGGVAIGALVGLIWAPCAGPVMAAAVVQIIQAKSGFGVVLTVCMFALGAGIPMLLIALMGRQVMSRIGFLKTHGNAVRRALGVVILLSAVLIYEGADVKLLAAAGDNTPTMANIKAQHSVLMGLDEPYDAPDFVGTQGWINSAPLNMADLRGKVVLIDFWTYSCINCVRTLPHLTAWDAEYRDKGLVIIGIHAPEFEFEKKLENVQAAVARFGIRYPVVQDNDLATWKNFNNKYWPAHYLINKDGKVVYTHYGEGEYDQTEGNIRYLLGLGEKTDKPSEDNFHVLSMEQTPETYLGYGRAHNFVGESPQVHDDVATYKLPATFKQNEWALEGAWRVAKQSIATATSNQVPHKLRLSFFAKKVFLVMGTESGKPVHARIELNGKPVETADVKAGVLTVDSERLYELIDQEKSQAGMLDIITDDVGLQAYAFTFGG